MRYYEYMFLIAPNERVKNEISQYKLMAGNLIGAYSGMHTTAHLTVHKPREHNPDLISSYIERIRTPVSNMPPVTLCIEKFEWLSHGEDSMTICAAIKRTYKTDNWFALLSKQLDIKPNWHPHISVTKAIAPEPFMLLWPVFHNINYESSFTADRLIILERERRNGPNKWQPYTEIMFQNRLGSQLNLADYITSR